ncbi:MAG: hypothetical protein ACKVP3_16915 [Hyphomicrobiaceae bacterium]
MDTQDDTDEKLSPQLTANGEIVQCPYRENRSLITPEDGHTKPTDRATIEIRIHELGQIFNSLDPSPFTERDLDASRAEVILIRRSINGVTVSMHDFAKGLLRAHEHAVNYDATSRLLPTCAYAWIAFICCTEDA